METDSRSLAAQRVLGRVFRDLPFGFAARLWDGRRIEVGKEQGSFTLVFHSASTFRRLMIHPTTLRFGQAYINGDLDVEGDFFGAVALANRIERLRLGIADRIIILYELGRL